MKKGIGIDMQKVNNKQKKTMSGMLLLQCVQHVETGNTVIRSLHQHSFDLH